MGQEVGRAPGDPQAGQLVPECGAGILDIRRDCGAEALLEQGHHSGLVRSEPCRIAGLAPPLLEFLVEPGRVTVNPGAGAGGREVDSLGRRRHVGVEPVGESRLPKDEIRHQPEHRGTERVALGQPVDGGGGADTGSSGSIGPVEDGHGVAGAPQVVSGHQTVDPRADNDDDHGPAV